MKNFNKLFFLLIATFLVGHVNAQERYLEEVFTDVDVQPSVIYGNNITVLSGSPAPQDLLMDVYTPAGDEATNRPVVVYFHTGSFLPAVINGQVTGAKNDSTAAEICRRLARQGYVAISATYRQGWNPVSLDQNVRTGTLLNAAYRGIQDARALIRFLRKDVAEGDNQFGVDPELITLWGQGTGGYISYGAAYLDSYEEIVLDKFVNSETFEVYVDTALSGGVEGLEVRPLNLVNHPGYPSDFKLAVNIGGALGDTSWIDGTMDEPATIGFHVLRDPFAPYIDGAVIVPTTQEFVVNVSGTRRVTQIANDNGSNSIFQAANDDTDDPINAINEVYKVTPIADTIPTTISTDNMFPFVTSGPASGPWEWWDFAPLAGTVAFINSIRPPAAAIDAMALDSTSRILNPDMSKEKAMRYIDTMMAFFNPRAYLALNLATSTKEILSAETVELTVGPNPVADVAFIRSAPDKPMKRLALYHLNGKMMRGIANVNSSTAEIHRQNLPPGIYILQAEFDEGIVSKKLVFK